MQTLANQRASTSTTQVLEAVRELHAKEQIATRETVAELTGLKLTIVDDRLSDLVDKELLRRVIRGVYVPVTQHPPARVICKRVLADGMVEIEIGSDVLLLTPKEDRALAELQAGASAQAIAIASSRQQSMLTTEFAGRIQRLENENRVLRRRIGMESEIEASPQLKLV